MLERIAVIVAHIVTIGMMVGWGFLVKWLGTDFALGTLCGLALAFLTIWLYRDELPVFPAGRAKNGQRDQW